MTQNPFVKENSSATSLGTEEENTQEKTEKAQAEDLHQDSSQASLGDADSNEFLATEATESLEASNDSKASDNSELSEFLENSEASDISDTSSTSKEEARGPSGKKDHQQVSNWSLFYKIYPFVVAMISIDIIAGLINTYMASKLSIAGMAAIGIGSTMISPILMFSRSLVQVMQSKYGFLYGKGEYEAVGSEFRQGTWMVIVASIFNVVCVLLLTTTLGWFGLEKEVEEVIRPYLLIKTLGLPFLTYTANLAFLNASLANRLPGLIASLASLVFIVPLNYVFMYGVLPGLEPNVVYSAWANNIDAILGLVVYLYLIKRNPKTFARLKLFSTFLEKINWQSFKENLKHGLPLAGQQVLTNSYFSLFVLLVAHLGTSVIAANQFTVMVFGLMNVFAIGSTSTVYTITSIRLGERDKGKLMHAIKINMVIAVAMAFITVSLATIYGHEITSFYLAADPQAVEIAEVLIVLISIFSLMLAVSNIFFGALMSFRDNYFSMYLTIICQWLIALPFSSIFAFTDWFGFPPQGIYAFYVGFIFIGAVYIVACIWRFRYWMKLPDKKLYALLRVKGLR